MVQASLFAASNKRLELCAAVRDKRYYRVDVNSTTYSRIGKLFDYFKYSSRWWRARLDYSPYLFIACCQRPYDKAVVPILSVELEITLNYCRLGKYIVGYVVLLENIHAFSRQFKAQFSGLVGISRRSYHDGIHSIRFPCRKLPVKYLWCITLGVNLVVKFRRPLVGGVAVCTTVTASLIRVYREAIIALDYKGMNYRFAFLFFKRRPSAIP